MARPLEVEVANFICRFGDAVLLDLLDEVVLPAFFSDEIRTYMETEYFFTDQSFRYLTKNDVSSLALCCRIVKNTIIRRHQVYRKEKGIVPAPQSLESAPSAVAVLLLQSHRLLYVREVPSAPSMTVFGSTFSKFMKSTVMAYRQSLYEERKKAGKKPKKKDINVEIQIPDVSVVPVVNNESLKEFVARFDVLNSLKIEVAPTNNELDNEDFFKSLRLRKTEVGSTRTVVQHANANGLDKKGCLKQVQAAKQGNVLIEMKGKDDSGDELKGNNEAFSVRANLPTTSSDVEKCADAAFAKYSELVESEVVQVGKPVDDYSEKLKASFKKHSQVQKNG